MRSYIAARLVVASLVALAPCAIADDDILGPLEFKHGIAFFHEPKYPADFTHLDYLNPDAPKGGTLVEATSAAFNTLAPLAESGTGAPSGFWFTGDPLIIRAGDEVSAFYGRLADGIAVTQDELAIVFRIHADAKWWDGVPVTANDVVYTIERRKQQTAAGFWLDFIESMQAIDDRHVAFHLQTPLTLNNVIMIQFTTILPEHYWRDRDPTVSTLEPGLGSGPYRVSALEPGRFIEYERVPDYWGKDIPVNRGRYNFETVRYEVYRDATVTREAFRKGLIDIYNETDVRFWHDSYDVPALEKGWIKKIRRHFGIEVGVRQGVGLNNRLARFKDRRVREALTLAMDFDWQNRTLHFGYRKRAHSYWPDTILTATGLPSENELELLEPFRDQLPPELFTRPFRFPSSEDRRGQLIKARQLLLDAGWRIVDGKLTNASGEVFTIEFKRSKGSVFRLRFAWSTRANLPTVFASSISTPC
jgi:microcin C transport system substrate-binding protein